MAEDGHELRAQARILFHPNDPRRHWALKARLLGEILRQDLWRVWGHASARAWAESELDLSPGEFVALVKLGRLMAQVQPPLDPDEWARLSRAKATQLLRIAPLAEGPPLARWVLQALQEPLAALRTRVDEALGAEVWQAWSVAVPGPLAALADVALVAALNSGEVVDGPVERPEDLIKDRTIRHQAFEHVIASYLAGVR